LNQR
jgi:serine/threonine protein kinase